MSKPLNREDWDKIVEANKVICDTEDAMYGRVDDIGELILKAVGISKKDMEVGDVTVEVVSVDLGIEKQIEWTKTLPYRIHLIKDQIEIEWDFYFSSFTDERAKTRFEAGFKKLKTGAQNYQKQFPTCYLFMDDDKIKTDVLNNIQNSAQINEMKRKQAENEKARKEQLRQEALAKLTAEERKILGIKKAG